MTTLPKKTRRRRYKPLEALTSTVTQGVREPGGPHLAGYVRVSTSDQSIQRQVDELVKYGVAVTDIYPDTASGKTGTDRPGWTLCWQQLEPGDVLVVHSLDRLGRDLQEVIKIEREIRERGCTLKVLAQDINTANPTGRLIFHILLTVAQFEREWNLERTMHGLQKARERGVKGGALPKFTDEQIGRAMDENNYNLSKAAKAVGCSKVTMMRRWDIVKQRRLQQGLDSQIVQRLELPEEEMASDG